MISRNFNTTRDSYENTAARERIFDLWASRGSNFYPHAGWVFYTSPPPWWSIPYTYVLHNRNSQHFVLFRNIWKVSAKIMNNVSTSTNSLIWYAEKSLVRKNPFAPNSIARMIMIALMELFVKEIRKKNSVQVNQHHEMNIWNVMISYFYTAIHCGTNSDCRKTETQSAGEYSVSCILKYNFVST